jgi:hypothetical protein
MTTSDLSMTRDEFSIAFHQAKAALDASDGDMGAAFAAFYQGHTRSHEHGYTYSVEISGSASMTLGPQDLYPDPAESPAEREMHEAQWLESLADNLQEWINAADSVGLVQFITHVDLINTECFSHGKACPDTGRTHDNLYVRECHGCASSGAIVAHYDTCPDRNP